MPNTPSTNDNEIPHRSNKIGFDKDGRLRFVEQQTPKTEFKNFDFTKHRFMSTPRLKQVKMKTPDGKIMQHIIFPKPLSIGAMEASGFGVTSSMSMQPGTSTGRQGAPSAGAQQTAVKKIRNIEQEMRQRYPEYFQQRPIPSVNIREAIDPYSFSVRNQFINAARTDPTLAPAIRKRKNAFFRNGFTLELEMKDKRSTVTHKMMTDEELDKFQVDQYQKYNIPLRQLEAWAKKPNIGLLKQMKKAYFSAIVQGRYLTKFFPPLSFLETHVLPFELDTMSTEEVHNVVIDKFTKQIVACRVASIDNEQYLLLPDEFVYGYINDDTMTKYESFYGRSDLEPVIQASRTNKFIVAEAYPKAAVAAYLPKVVGQIPVDGTEEEKEGILKNRAIALSDPELQVLLVESSEHTELQALPQDVNHEMIRNIRNDVDEIMIGGSWQHKGTNLQDREPHKR